MADEVLKFDKIFAIVSTAMRLNWSHPDIARDRIWYYWYSINIAINMGCFVLLTYSIIFYEIPERRMDDAFRIINMLCIIITVNFKYYLLTYYRYELKVLIDKMDEDYDLSQGFSSAERTVVYKHAMKGLKACRMWSVAAICTSVFFPVKAMFIMLYSWLQGDFHYEPIFEINLPPFLQDHKQDHIIFWGLFLICSAFDMFAILLYLAFDSLVPIFLSHNGGQLEICSSRIMMVFSQTTNEEEILINLKKLIRNIQDVYRFVDSLNEYFDVQYEYSMKLSTTLISIAAFEILMGLKQGYVNVEFLMFLVADIIFFFLPCYYGDYIMKKSELLRQAIYSCGWEGHPSTRVRRLVLMMLTRSSHPIVFRTLIYPLCLDTFAEMCRQSYGIFNMMNAAWG